MGILNSFNSSKVLLKTWYIISVPFSRSLVWLCNSMDRSTQGFLVHHQLLQYAQTHVYWAGNSISLIHCCALHLLPSFFHSIRVFYKKSFILIRWPKYWSFIFNISPSIEYLRLIFFRIDSFNHLAVQGTLKSLFQHHISKASILQH